MHTDTRDCREDAQPKRAERQRWKRRKFTERESLMHTTTPGAQQEGCFIGYAESKYNNLILHRNLSSKNSDKTGKIRFDERLVE